MSADTAVTTAAASGGWLSEVLRDVAFAFSGGFYGIGPGCCSISRALCYLYCSPLIFYLALSLVLAVASVWYRSRFPGTAAQPQRACCPPLRSPFVFSPVARSADSRKRPLGRPGLVRRSARGSCWRLRLLIACAVRKLRQPGTSLLSPSNACASVSRQPEIARSGLMGRSIVC